MKDAKFSAAGLLALYDRISDAEDAIPRLRRFVLDLAVRGKLVDQDPSDEPAAELLKRQLLLKRQAWEAEQIQKAKLAGKPHRAVKQYREPPHESGQYELPTSWTWASSSEVCERIENGNTPPSSEMFEGSGDIPFLKVYNLTKFGALDFSIKPTFISRKTHEIMLARSRIIPGDVLMNIVGPPLGKVSLVPDDFPEWNTNQAVVLFRPTSAITSRFLTACLLADAVLSWITRTAQATVGQSNISVSSSRILPLPLPPLAEQQRIVAKVDELMALCDQLEQARAGREAVRDQLTAASLSRLTTPDTDAETFQSHARFALQSIPTLTTRPDQIKTLRQTILNLAVRGKLVEQDPSDEPAAELHRTLAEEFKKTQPPTGRGKRSEASGIIAGPPYDVPALWSWVQMGDLGQTNIGLTYSPSNVGPTGVPVLRSNNVQNGKIDLNNLVRVDVVPKTSAMVAEGDMLICARNGSRSLVGKAALIERLSEPMAFGAFMALFRSPINPYLHLFLASPVFRQVIDEVNTTTINQITQANLRSTFVPLPPLAEQHRIVAKVDALMALCDQLEASLTTTATTRSKLLNSLLHKALNGALGGLSEAAA